MDLTWVEISLNALRHNLKEIKKKIGTKVRICGVVKDNAYGHGLLEISRTLLKEKVDSLAVADVNDAIYLRKKGINLPIINLVSILPSQVKDVVKFNISQSVSNSFIVDLLNKEAKANNKTAKIHIEVDTGMGRLGVFPEKLKGLLEDTGRLRNVKIEGIFTHFSSASENENYTKNQIKIFNTVLRSLNNLISGSDTIIHSANSPALIHFKESYFNMVRPGLMLYGLSYNLSSDRKKIKLKPVLTWKTKIIALKYFKKGKSISYGRTYKTKRDTSIAVLAVGYADGYNRLLSNKGEVIIKDRKYPVVGRVCMDMTMVDIGRSLGIKVGDDVILIGKSKNHSILVEEIAEKCHTIPNEIVCGIHEDIKRIYKETYV